MLWAMTSICPPTVVTGFSERASTSAFSFVLDVRVDAAERRIEIGVVTAEDFVPIGLAVEVMWPT